MEERLTLEDVETAVNEPVPTCEMELVPGKPPATVRALTSLADADRLTREFEARRLAGVNVELGGKRIPVTETMIQLAVVLCAAVVEPKLNFPAAVKLCHRYGPQVMAIQRWMQTTEFDAINSRMEAAKAEIQDDPFPAPGGGAGVEAPPAAE